MRIAKAAFTIFFLFMLAWTPYAVVALTGAYGNRLARNRLLRIFPDSRKQRSLTFHDTLSLFFSPANR